jgi:LPXTG-site transpeptidase (sortase) family protein
MGTTILTGSRKFWRIAAFVLLTATLCAWAAAQPGGLVKAQAPTLQLYPITWNVIGLDAANPTLGPAEYLAGVRVCTSGEAAPNLSVTLAWTSANTYINLTSSATQTLANPPVDTCHDFYFEITVTRDALALNTMRQFKVTATSGLSTIELYSLQLDVFGLAPSATLHTDSISGPATVAVGDTVQYVTHLAADQAFGSLVYSLNFPPEILRLHSVAADYPAVASNDSTWEDACSWQDNPDIPGTYNTCLTDTTITGSAVVTYTFQVLTAGSGTLIPTVYGYSGTVNGTYLYASDFGVDVLSFTAQDIGTSTPTTTSTTTATSPAGTPTSTTTATVTPTGPTPTRTPTSGTLTPTLTGTITPNPNGTKMVSPTQAGIGSNFNFTIRVSNNGSAPATNVILTDSFANYTYLDIADATTQKGTVNINGRVVTVTIGTILPREVVDVVIRVRVNSTAKGTPTANNSATISFNGGSRTTNQVSFRIVGGSSLPGTGQNPFPAPTEDMRIPLLISAVILAIGGLAAFRLAIWAWTHHRQALRWYLVTGSVLAVAAGAAGACSISEPTNGPDTDLTITMGTGDVAAIDITATATVNPLAIMPAYMFATPGPMATLPSYPVPSPVIGTATPLPGGSKQLDTTNIERIIISSINVDNEVAYVPFDGQTWLINGLRQEVAWMGDTSWPGLGGNTALAGHITVAGEGYGPFRNLYDLKEGDSIEVYTGMNVYTYEVSYKVAVEETDLTILEQSENPQITLITCVDWDQNLKLYLRRYAVIANLVSVTPIVMGQGR